MKSSRFDPLHSCPKQHSLPQSQATNRRFKIKMDYLFLPFSFEKRNRISGTGNKCFWQTMEKLAEERGLMNIVFYSPLCIGCVIGSVPKHSPMVLQLGVQIPRLTGFFPGSLSKIMIFENDFNFTKLSLSGNPPLVAENL